MVRRNLRSLIPIALLALAVAVFASTASAGKPSAKSSGKSSYSPTLSVSLPLSASTLTGSTDVNYTVSGCGYSSSYGGVTIVVYSPVAISFAGQMPDSSGCISVSNFSTQGAGSYEVDAYQQIHNNKSTLVASTSFTFGS